MKLFGVKTSKDSAKSIMRGNAMGSIQKLLSPFPLAVTKEFHILESIAADQT
jgi:hypothetical protein